MSFRFILYVEVIFIKQISIVFSSVRDEEIFHRGSASSHCFEILFTTVCHKRKNDVNNITGELCLKNASIWTCS